MSNESCNLFDFPINSSTRNRMSQKYREKTAFYSRVCSDKSAYFRQVSQALFLIVVPSSLHFYDILRSSFATDETDVHTKSIVGLLKRAPWRAAKFAPFSNIPEAEFRKNNFISAHTLAELCNNFTNHKTLDSRILEPVSTRQFSAFIVRDANAFVDALANLSYGYRYY